MAALGFFRKNQKLVFWIMVVLMVMFTLGLGGGGQAIINLFRPDGGDKVIATVGGDEITVTQYTEAVRDVEIFQDELGLGDPFRMLMAEEVRSLSAWFSELPAKEKMERLLARYSSLPNEREFLAILTNTDRPMAWLLLAREARGLGFEASEKMVDEFVATLPKKAGKIQTEEMRRAAGNFLVILAAFESVATGEFVPEHQLLRKYRDMNHLAELAIVELRADEYVSLYATDTPTEEEINALFEECKDQFRDSADNKHKFGFGYRRAKQVQLEHIFISLEKLAEAEAAKPSEDDVWKYWEEHPGEFTKRVPVASTQPTSQPTSGPTQYTTETITDYGADAKRLIRAKLRLQTARSQMEGIVRKVAGAIDRHIDADEDSLVTSTESALWQAVDDVPEALGEHVWENTPLGRKAIEQHPLLGKIDGNMLAKIAFSLKEFGVGQPLIEVGKPIPSGLPVIIDGEFSGVVLCRVVAAHQDTALADASQVRAQVIKDWKIARAYGGIALKRAHELKDKAIQNGLAAALEGTTEEILTLGPVPRMQLLDLASSSEAGRSIARFVYAELGLMRPPRQLSLGEYALAALSPPYREVSSRVLTLRPDQAQKFLAAVFGDQPGTDTQPAKRGPVAAKETHFPTTAGAPPEEVLVTELPAQRTVYVVQRVRMTPPYVEDYRQRRGELIAQYGDITRSRMRMDWFQLERIKKRTGYVRLETDD